MATHRATWHSVSAVTVDSNRCCVSNYYFSARSPESGDYFHVTSFRGRPEQPLRDWVLRTNTARRTAVRQLFPLGMRQTTHFCDRGSDQN
jgi:hypothetical protein